MPPQATMPAGIKVRAMKGLPAAFGEEFFTNLADPLRALPDQIRKHGVDLVALYFHSINALTKLKHGGKVKEIIGFQVNSMLLGRHENGLLMLGRDSPRPFPPLNHARPRQAQHGRQRLGATELGDNGAGWLFPCMHKRILDMRCGKVNYYVDRLLKNCFYWPVKQEAEMYWINVFQTTNPRNLGQRYAENFHLTERDALDEAYENQTGYIETIKVDEDGQCHTAEIVDFGPDFLQIDRDIKAQRRHEDSFYEPGA